MKILCTADIHLGRRAGRIPSHVGEQERFATRQVWDDIVQTALEEQVDLLLIAGDVVDEKNRYFEAIGPLESGIRRLGEAGIQTVAVAGNHDADTLPAVADALCEEEFLLLGRDGKWQWETVNRNGESIHLGGWSFPTRHVRRNPLAGFRPPDNGGEPLLILLHTDLDGRNTPYAPVQRLELERQPDVHFWLLGHIHAPRAHSLDNGVRALYPGSPQALDPGERGAHGAWLLTLSEGRFAEPAQIPLSRVRYETVVLALDGVETEAEFMGWFPGALRGALVNRMASPGPAECVCARVRLEGRTPLCRELDRLAQKATDIQDFYLDGAIVAVEQVENHTRPAIDLEGMARGSSPPALLAQILLDLESGNLSEESRRLWRQVEEAVGNVHRATTYASLDDEPPSETAVMERACTLLLGALLEQ